MSFVVVIASKKISLGAFFGWPSSSLEVVVISVRSCERVVGFNHKSRPGSWSAPPPKFLTQPGHTPSGLRLSEVGPPGSQGSFVLRRFVP